jgi:serine/threonine protein kinase
VADKSTDTSSGRHGRQPDDSLDRRAKAILGHAGLGVRPDDSTIASPASHQSPGKLHRGGGGFRPGQQIQQWTLVRYVAAGAFGHVWLAQREGHKRLYIMKLVAASEAVHERAGVEHWKVVNVRGTAPGLMPIVEDGDVDGWYYYVMPAADDLEVGFFGLVSPEHYDPCVLNRYLEERKYLPIEDTLRMAEEVLSGLCVLVNGGIGHDDVKPQNIVRIQGSWRLCDPGLVTPSSEQKVSHGTPAYLPPDGRPDDCFALAKTLYAALTGDVKFERLESFRRESVRIGGHDPSDRRAKRLRNVICNALEDERDSRFVNALAMRRALRPALPHASRSRRAVMVAAAAISLIAGGLIIGKLLPRASPLPKLRIESMRVEHYRGGAYQGQIGGKTHTEAVRINDEIRVLVKLSRPAFCYLLAFTADGGSTVCLPAAGSTDAELIPGLEHSYPIDVEEITYDLDEGTGLTAFVAMTSNEPYSALRIKQIGALPWAGGSAKYVWSFDGRMFRPRERLARGPKKRDEKVPEQFRAVCEAIAGRTDLAAVYGIVFPVTEALEPDESTDTREGMP